MALSERVLTLRELNRALLARQLLLERARVPVPRAVERVGALQAQFPMSPYLALWSRLAEFKREALARALERRRVVKATLMRATLHIISAADYVAFAGVLNQARAADMLRRLDEPDVDELIAQTLELAKEPRLRTDLIELLGGRKLTPDDRRAWMTWHLLTAGAELVHMPESAAWRKTVARAPFVSSRAWLGRGGAAGPEAVQRIVRRYLAAFGPAPVVDAGRWTGVSTRLLREGLEGLPLRTFRDEAGRELLDLARAPLPPEDRPVPVRFLPMWDSALLAHDDRTRILPDAYRKAVIRRNGDVLPTFLLDGFVAGTWEIQRERLRLEPFKRLAKAARRELEDEGERLLEFAR